MSENCLSCTAFFCVADIAKQRADIAEQRLTTQLQIAGMKSRFAYLVEAYRSQDTQGAIRANAIEELPALLQRAGIVADKRKGLLPVYDDDGQPLDHEALMEALAEFMDDEELS